MIPIEEVPLQPLRVLLVDDEDEPRELAAMALKRLGMDVVTADCGDAALACLREQHFYAIVSDLWMGARDGFELAEAVRHSAAVPPHMIALSSLPLFSAWERARQAGFDAYIQKPVGDEQLQRTFRQLRRSRKPSSDAR